MSSSYPKMDQACRVCLQERSKVAPLFNSVADLPVANDLAGKIYLCTRVTLRREQALPQSICHECLNELEVADRFRLKCLRSNKILQGILTVKNDKQGIVNKMEEAANEMARLIKNEDVDAVSFEVEIDSYELHEAVKDEQEPIATHPEVTEPPVHKLSEEAKSQNGPHICHECGKHLKTEASLLRHTVTMHKSRKRAGRVTGHGSERRFHCTECTYSSPHSQSLVYHMRRHTGERPHRCECGQAFTQPSSLSAHRKTHSDATYYTCPECGKQFKHKDVYERHKTVHSEAKFPCVVCGKALKTQHTLNSHMNRHLGLKNFSCETCGATFVTSVELINHQKKHDGLRRFQCHLCSYKTYMKKLLVVHIKRHTGERDYKCELCSYDCHTKHELKCHQRKHTKEKRYPCATCGQRFVYSTSLNKHMLRRHSLKFVWSATVDRRVVKAIS